jgi:hypothetical protein
MMQLQEGAPFHNSRAQMIGQILIYVVAVVLVGLILAYGYNAIITIKNSAEQVSFIQFEKELSSVVETISPDYNSVKIRGFEVPSGYTKVCFVKNYGGFPTLSGTGYPMLEDSVNEKVQKNVFLIKPNANMKSIFIGDISVEDESGDADIICLKTINHQIKLKFMGKGDHALLSEAKT